MQIIQKLKDWFKHIGQKTRYDYDFGDSWEHIVLLEKILPAETGVSYPRFLKGKCVCPPEDCGGIPGYYELIDIMKDPKHERYEECSEWLGADTLDPEAFDPNQITFTDPAERLQEMLAMKA